MGAYPAFKIICDSGDNGGGDPDYPAWAIVLSILIFLSLIGVLIYVAVSC